MSMVFAVVWRNFLPVTTATQQLLHRSDAARSVTLPFVRMEIRLPHLQTVLESHLSSHAAPPEHAHEGSVWCDCDDHQSTWSSVGNRHCCSVYPRSPPYGSKLGPVRHSPSSISAWQWQVWGAFSQRLVGPLSLNLEPCMKAEVWEVQNALSAKLHVY